MTYEEAEARDYAIYCEAKKAIEEEPLDIEKWRELELSALEDSEEGFCIEDFIRRYENG
jgi:hypothetical protein